MDWMKVALGAVLTVMLVACGGGGGDDTPPPPPPADGGTDTGVDSGPPPENCTGGPSAFFVANQLDVGREDPTGVAPGFNLDGRNSDETDEQGCYQPDFLSPDGDTGIDNQLATLAPTLESALGADLGTTIEESIADGSIIILMELENLDSTTSDSCVNLNLFLGEVPGGGAPTLGGDGLITAGQTFDIDAASLDASGNPVIRVEGARVNAGNIKAGPVDLELSIPFDATTTIDLNIRNATVQFDVSDTALSNGVIGGELNIDELVTAVMNLGMDLPVDLVQSTLESVADLSPDSTGICQAVSVAVVFDAVTAVKGVVATGG